MKLNQYLKTLKNPLRQASLCLLVKDNQILLAKKKRGFGMGKINGIGGKKDEGETIEETAQRETLEEIGVAIKQFEQVAVLNFHFPYNIDWGMQVVTYLVKDWVGEPTESEEVAPLWFDKDKIPFEKMWTDGKYWLNMVLDGKKIQAQFLFGKNEEILDYKIKILQTFL